MFLFLIWLSFLFGFLITKSISCFIFRRKRAATVPPVPLVPFVAEDNWQAKRARVSGKRRSVHSVFGSTEPGHVPGHAQVHTEDNDVAAEFETEPWNVEVHTEDDDFAAQFQTDNIQTDNWQFQTDETAFEVETEIFEEVNDQPSSVKKPVNKTKMLSELVCVEEGEPKTRCAKKGTRRGRKGTRRV